SNIEPWSEDPSARQDPLRHEIEVTLIFSPDGKLLASASNYGLVEIVEVPTGRNRMLRGRDGTLNDIRFDPTSRFLATVGRDAGIHFWDLERGTTLEIEGSTNSVSFSHDGTRALLLGATARIVDLATGEWRTIRDSHACWFGWPLFGGD